MGNLSIQDLQKEMLFREMPQEVKQHLITSFPTASLEDLADQAELYFELDGHTKMAASRSRQGVNFVSEYPHGTSSGSSAVSEGPMGYEANSAQANEAPIHILLAPQIFLRGL